MLILLLPLASAGTVIPRGPFDISIATALGMQEPLIGTCLRRPGALVPRQDDFQPKLETVNATSWTSAMKHLRETEAHVVCLQEHKLVESRIDEANQQVLAAGWRAIWSPATITSKRAPSCGVAICVRDGIGISRMS